ncbi:MAG: NosD domain-containing protein, partial [Promethearchaeota archaeon]
MYHLKKRDLSRYFIIFFFLAICLLVGKLCYSNFEIQSRPLNDGFGGFDNKLKPADLWSNEPRIIIDGNWSETKQAYDWCDGEGTWEEPYIIENVTINANNSKYCILINNSLTEPFIIRNSNFFNSSANFAGIELYNTNNGTLFKNNISLNNGIGIRLFNSDNNSISNNIIKNNTDGIIIGDLCTNNTIITNKITDNSVGVNLSSTSCNATLIYNNTFSNNVLSANDNGNNNKWDNGTLGNYWDDYAGGDLNDDGIGDSPYSISGTAGSQDNYPIWDDGENVNPELTVHLPYNNTYWSSAPLINVSAVDDNLEYIWYNVTGNPTIEFLEHNVTEVLNDTLWDSLSEGEFQISFFANDTNGNVNNSIILTLYKDPNSPTLLINSPSDGTYWNSRPNIQATATDTHFDSVWYEVGSFKVMLINGVAELLNLTIWNSLPDEGSFTVYFFANDSAGNINNLHSRTLYKDIVVPSLTVNLPSDGTYWNTRPNIQATVTDTYFDSVWYEVASTKIILTNGIADLLNLTIWNSLADEGSFTINFFANDSAGNVNNLYSRTLFKDVVIPSLVINLPVNNTYWNSRPNIQITVTDMYFDSVWYKVGGTKVSLTNGVSEIFDQGIWDGLSDEGLFIIYFYANDSAGNENNIYSITLHKDIVMPSLTINSPPDGTYWNSIPNIQATATDPHFDSIWYMVGSTTILLENSISEPLDTTIWNGLSDEDSFIVYFYANDSAGNINSMHNLTLFKDIVTPSLVINLPVNNTYWNSQPDIQATVTDTYFDSVWYLVGSTKIMLTNGVSEALDLALWDSLLVEGLFNIYFYANDSAGNTFESVHLSLYRDILAPRVSIALPTNNTYWNTIPSIKFSAIDPNFDSLYYIVGGTQVQLTNNTEQLLESAIWNSLPQGKFIIEIYANDTLGNLNNSYRITLFKDTIAPIITINSPNNNTYWNDPPSINLTVYDPNFTILYYMVGPTQIWLTNNTAQLLDLTIWNSLPQGLFQVRIYAWDSFGHLNDSLILELYKDTLAPEVIIQSPVNNTYWNTPPPLNITINDPNFDSLYYVVGTTHIGLTNNIEQLLDLTIWNGLPQGEFQIEIYANDSFGHLNSSYVITLYKDTVIPNLTVNLPLNGTYWKILPTINVTVLDTNFDSVWYKVGSTTIILENGISEAFDLVIWNSLLEEDEFSIYFYANDSAGNMNSIVMYTLYKDIRNPIITINYPDPNYLFGPKSPGFNISISEGNLNSTWYTIIGSSTNFTFSGLTGTINQALWDEFGNGTLTLRFYANDTLNNLGFAEVTVSKNIYAPIINIVDPQSNDLYGIVAPDFM